MDYKRLIYIKLTNACNLKCKHCYNAQMNNCENMSEETLRRVFLYVTCMSKLYPNKKIEVQFHGGEPMLYDIEALTKFVDDLKPYENVKMSITTNLAYKLTNDKIEFLKKMTPYDDKPFIMTSWDYKIRFTSRQEELWKKNIATLHKEGVQVQPIVCITNKLVETFTPSDIYSQLEKLNIHNVNFERLTLTGNAASGKLKPTNREVDEWLYAAYLEAKERGFIVPLFEDVENSVNGFLFGCRARQCMNTVLTINPDGTCAACPNVAKYWYGTLNETGDLVSNNIKKLYLDHMENNKNINCYLCKYFKYCNCDCCQLSYDESGCPGLTKIYEHLLSEKD